MKKRIAFLILIAVALFLSRETSYARWMNPNNGRFQTMDSYEGNPNAPETFHKYVYCSSDPVNGTDPTGLFREIPSNWPGGKDAEAPVVADFISKRGSLDTAALTSIHGVLDYASKTGYRGLGRLIPDLVDVRLHEIYDVKSWSQTGEGMAKVQGYAYAFNEIDPNAKGTQKWHAGLTYEYGGMNPHLLPGTSNGKQVYAVYFPTEAGVIPYKLYEADNNEDRKRIPVPVFVADRVRRPSYQYSYQSAPLGNAFHAQYYATTIGRAAVTGALLAVGTGIAVQISLAPVTARYTN